MAPAVTVALAGVTAMDFTVGTLAVTVNAAVAVSPFAEAVTVVAPAAAAVAKPDVLIVATVVLEELQVTPDVSVPVVPSLYVATTENCCVAPAVTVALSGVTAMDLTVGVLAVTVSAVVAVSPFAEAVIVVMPAATAVTNPDALTVATAVLEEFQITPEVRAPVVPSL
ncbi:MAG TPA: hypothetical protein VFB43_06280 [Terracidiphilus sp.]|nr:hypothetical protein [Terracidiphilus sp.]